MPGDNNDSSGFLSGITNSQIADAAGMLTNVPGLLPGPIGNIVSTGCNLVSGECATTEGYAQLKSLKLDFTRLSQSYPALKDYLADLDNRSTSNLTECVKGFGGMAAGGAVAGIPGALVGGFVPALFGGSATHNSVMQALEWIEKRDIKKTGAAIPAETVASILTGALPSRLRERIQNRSNPVASEAELRSVIPDLPMESDPKTGLTKTVSQQVADLVNRGMPVQLMMEPAKIVEFAQRIDAVTIKQSPAHPIQQTLPSATAFTVKDIARNLLAMGKTITYGENGALEIVPVERSRSLS